MCGPSASPAPSWCARACAARAPRRPLHAECVARRAEPVGPHKCGGVRLVRLGGADRDRRLLRRHTQNVGPRARQGRAHAHRPQVQLRLSAGACRPRPSAPRAAPRAAPSAPPLARLRSGIHTASSSPPALSTPTSRSGTFARSRAYRRTAATPRACGRCGAEPRRSATYSRDVLTYRHDLRPQITFSPDGRWVLSGGDDGLVKLWDLTMGKLVHEFPQQQATHLSAMHSRPRIPSYSF